MKILFVHDGYIYVKDGNYYSSAYNDEIIEKYKTLSDDITFFVRSSTTFDDRIVPIINSNISLVGVNNFKNIHFLSSMQLIKQQLLFEIHMADFVIIRMPSDLGRMAYKIAEEQNKRYVVEVVGCPFDSLRNHSILGRIIAPFYYLSQKRIIKGAKAVKYVTSKYLQEKYPTNGETISCSDVQLSNFSLEKMERRLSCIRQMDKTAPIVLGTIGSINMKYKGFDTVIKAISELNADFLNYRYIIVGGGKEQWIKNVIEKYDAQEYVEVINGLEHEKIFEWLYQIDIYIQPSRTEGLPRALIEAMSTACPCIGSNAGGITELLDEHVVFQKGKVQNLKAILVSFNGEMMCCEAKRNFCIAKQYEKEILYEKEIGFYKKLMNVR